MSSNPESQELTEQQTQEILKAAELVDALLAQGLSAQEANELLIKNKSSVRVMS